MTAKPIDDPLPTSVPAKELARHIGRYQRQALVRPITITAHGQPTHVLMSVDEYRRLKRRDRVVLSVDTMTVEQIDELLAMLEAQDIPESDEYDRELDGWTPWGCPPRKSGSSSATPTFGSTKPRPAERRA